MDKREVIIVSARRLFARFGPHKTTVEEIIRLARVAKGTFYRHFANKDVLLLEVLNQEAREHTGAIRAAVDQAPSARQKLRAYWITGTLKMMEMQNYHGISEDTFPAVADELKAFADGIFERMQGMIAEILDFGVRRGEIVVDHIDKTAYTLFYAVGMDDLKTMRRFRRVQALEIEEMVDRLVELVFSGLEPRG